MENNGHSRTKTTKKQLKARPSELEGLLNAIHQNLSLSHDLPVIADWPKRHKKLVRFVNLIQSMADIPKAVLSLPDLKTYTHAQILIHRKGGQIIQSYMHNKLKGDQTLNLSVGEFNTLFTLVKKSKSKIFDHTQLAKTSIQILGTFHARELSFQDHNVIFILSRNGFLPPTREELKAFNDLGETLSPLISGVLATSAIKRKTKILDAVLSSYHSAPRDIQDGPLDVFHSERIALLGELLNTLKHELSNPLFGLKLSADLMASETVNDENASILKEISSSVQRGQNIIGNFSKLYSGDIGLVPVKLKKLLAEIFTLTKSETRQIQKEIFFENIEDEENFQMTSNPTWLTQIFFNLIINSAQAMEGCQIQNKKMVIHIRRDAEDKNKIEFFVSDNGPGVSATQQENLFHAFQTTKGQGTGLGLVICKNLAEKLGGNIKYHAHSPSFSDGGACFKMELYAHPAR